MTNDPSATLILAVPGTQETQELTRAAVLEGIRNGQITPDQWVWSPAHNDWKQVSELPELQVPPTPAPAFANSPAPAAMSAHFPLAPAQVTPQPQVRVVSTGPTASQQLARTQYSRPMEIKHEFPFFKVLFAILFLAAAGVVAGNYFMVDQPLVTNFATTSFASIPVYGHLGAFAQPGALVIHVPPTKDLNADNFADFLTALAKSTPPQPFNDKPFDGVGLTASWQSQYIFGGVDWAKLGQMTSASNDERKKFIIDHIEQIDGTGLVNVKRTTDPAITESENKAWEVLVANFLPKAQ